MQSNTTVFCSQRGKEGLAIVISNEEHLMMTSDWLRVEFLLSEISHCMAREKKKLAPRTFIRDLHVFKEHAIRSFHKR